MWLFSTSTGEMPVCTFAEVARGTTMVLNRADECRQRADECRRNAAQVADDVLRVTYLDLARRWRLMAYQAESVEQKGTRPQKKLRLRTSK